MKSLTSLLENPLELEAYLNRKLVLRKDLAFHAASLKQEGFKVVTLNGSFDLMHAGHLYILFEAKKQGDRLIVALNSDASIQTYKGRSRPMIPLAYRLQMLAAMEWVDYVTYFDETDPRAILELIKPDVHVNGAEYGEDCIEKKTVIENGGKIHLVPRIPGLATSDIIKKIQGLCAK